MAVRLVRWLATPVEKLASVADGIATHSAALAWVDRALTVLWEGDAGAGPAVSKAYREVCEAVRDRRTALDEEFAQRLAVWARAASDQNSGGCLLIEQVLATIAVPLAGGAVATDRGAGRDEWRGRRRPRRGTDPRTVVGGRAWHEPRRRGVRDPFGHPGQPGEPADGEAGRGRPAGGEGRLRRVLAPAPAGRGAVPPCRHRRAGRAPAVRLPAGGAVRRRRWSAVVLNTIDYALDHGREGDRTGWSVADITYLPELLDAAFGYGRPVLVVADHGHVLDRFPDVGPVAAPGAQSARWRTGTPEPGEIALTGPRVGEGDGSVVVPWRDDIRYTQRRSGYHGGAALAEMTVPVLALVPSVEHLPDGWHLLTADAVVPPWWEPASARYDTSSGSCRGASTRTASARPRRRKAWCRCSANHQHPQCRSGRWATAVVDSEVYEAQRAFVPKPPAKDVVAAVIDALVEAGGDLPLSTVATVAGRAGSTPGVLRRHVAALAQRRAVSGGVPCRRRPQAQA